MMVAGAVRQSPVIPLVHHQQVLGVTVRHGALLAQHWTHHCQYCH